MKDLLAAPRPDIRSVAYRNGPGTMQGKLRKITSSTMGGLDTVTMDTLKWPDPGSILRMLSALVLAIAVVSVTSSVSGQSVRLWVEVEVLENLTRAEDLAATASTADLPLEVYPNIEGKYSVAHGPLDEERASEIFRTLQLDPDSTWPRVRLVPEGVYYVPELETVTIEDTEQSDIDSIPASQDEAFTPDNGQQLDIDFLLSITTEERPSDLPAASGEQSAMVNDEVEFTELPEVKFNTIEPDDVDDIEPVMSEITGDELNQVALRLLGYYHGPIDGIFGRGSIAGLNRYLEDRGLATGEGNHVENIERLISDYQSEFGNLGSQWLETEELGVRIILPTELVNFDRISPPYVYYNPADSRGMSIQLISALGDRKVLEIIHESLHEHVGSNPVANPIINNAFTVISTEGQENFYARVIHLDESRIRGAVMSWPDHQDTLLGDYSRMIGSSVGENSNHGFLIYSIDELTSPPKREAGHMIARIPARSGSGFYLSETGHVFTSFGNVSGCVMITVDNIHEYRIMGTMPDQDIAVLEPKMELDPLAFARFRMPEEIVSTFVYTAGYPFQGTMVLPTVTRHALSRIATDASDAAVLVIDGNIARGEIGGPVADETGNIVGVLRRSTGTTGDLPVGFPMVMPSMQLDEFLDDYEIDLKPALYGWEMEPQQLTRRLQEYTVPVHCYES